MRVSTAALMFIADIASPPSLGFVCNRRASLHAKSDVVFMVCNARSRGCGASQLGFGTDRPGSAHVR